MLHITFSGLTYIINITGSGFFTVWASRCWQRVCGFYYVEASQVALFVKNSPANAGDTGDMGLIPELGRSPGGWHGNLLQYSCLENPVDRGAWPATVHSVTKNWTWLKWLSIAHKPSIPTSVETFYHKQGLNFVKAFSSSIEIIMIFIMWFVNVVYHLDVESCSHKIQGPRWV